MKYCYVNNNNIVEAVIPEFNPALPNVPMEKRYSASFVSKLIPDETETVLQGYIYDNETGTFSAPPEPEEYIPDSSESEDVPETPSITIDDLALAVAELAEKQESDKLDLELAIAELAELTM